MTNRTQKAVSVPTASCGRSLAGGRRGQHPPVAEMMRFGSLDIAHDATVLAPRPWTVAQSRWAAEIDGDLPDGSLLELCSGAGQIGLLAAVLGGRALVQVDRNPTACAFARRNAAASGVAARVEVRNGDMGDAIGQDERFAVVLADPPYVPSAETPSFPDDPLVAIDGGADGLALISLCLAVGAAHLLPGGAIILQVRGEPQATATAGLLDRAGAPALAVVEVRTFGSDRALVLLRQPGDGS